MSINLPDINTLNLIQKMEILVEVTPKLSTKKCIEIANIIISSESEGVLKQLKDGLRSNLAIMNESTIDAIYTIAAIR